MGEIRWGREVSFYLEDNCSVDVIAAVWWATLLQSLGTYAMVTWEWRSIIWWQFEMMLLVFHGKWECLSVMRWTIMLLFPSIKIGIGGSSSITVNPMRKTIAWASSRLQGLSVAVSSFMNVPVWSPTMTAAALDDLATPSTLSFKLPLGGATQCFGWAKVRAMFSYPLGWLVFGEYSIAIWSAFSKIYLAKIEWCSKSNLFLAFQIHHIIIAPWRNTNLSTDGESHSVVHYL